MGGLSIQVGSDDAGQFLEIQPSTAIDGTGEFISLSPDGQADISPVEPGEADRQISAPFRLSTSSHANETRYLTIEHNLVEPLFGVDTNRIIQRPWLRLQPAFGDDALAADAMPVVLAIVIFDVDGSATIGVRDDRLPYRQRMVGGRVDELQFRHDVASSDTAGESQAAKIAAGTSGGLRIIVSDSTDSVVFDANGEERFSSLEIQAEDVRVSGDLHSQGDLRVRGASSLRKVQVDSLHVTGNVTMEGNLNVAGAVNDRNINDRNISEMG